MENVWLHRYCVLLAVCTLFLVLAGASVTSNQAGLSVPDWPLSYGQVMPEMEGGVFYEHGHRMIASVVGFMTIILAIWIWRADKRKWMRRLGMLALAAVILQGVLGGMTVLFMLPPAISISHACLAQLFFAATAAIALFTSPSWKRGPSIVEDSGWPSIRSLAIAVPVLVLVQVALGAAYRHRVLTVIPHIIGAIFVIAFILLVAVFVLAQFGPHRDLKRTAVALIGVTSIQMLFGIAAYLVRVSTSDVVTPTPQLVLYTVIHAGVGALTMAVSVLLAIQVLRHVRPRVPHAAHRGVSAVS
ncbi:MAG: COX15/CtaA family protein [Bryobacteraceae bacterium]